jgi:hypothetical protein
VRGSVYGVTIAAAGAAQLVAILAAGYLADRTSVYLLLADAPCYLLAGVLFFRRRQPNPARTTTDRGGRLPQQRWPI